MFEEVRQQFKEVISFSQNIPERYLDTDEFLDQYLEAKRDIIEAFDGKLIYEVPEPVQFHLDPKDRSQKFNDFVYRIGSIFDNYELANFLESNEKGFYDNVVLKAYEKGDIKIPIGMKLVKAFKFFEKDKSLLEKYQQQASQVIQEDKIEGKLCFSVHPLDFLSVSVNTYNWRSCHALDGEYCAGNLSYMLDKSTVVCYLKGEDNVRLPMFPEDVLWNSKKWRVLLYLSDRWDMIFAGRQYPFSSKSGMDLSLEHFLPAIKANCNNFSHWKWDYIDSYVSEANGGTYGLTEKYIPIRGRLKVYDDMVENGENSLQFNDLLQSSTYHSPYYSLSGDYVWIAMDDGEIPHFTIGREVKCLCCGQERIRDHDMMVCRTCAAENSFYDNEDRPTCDCCGNRIFDGDWYEVEGEVVCAVCAEMECFICECCDRMMFNSEKHYDRSRDEYICTYCREERLTEDE
jgi:hypothetical protein